MGVNLLSITENRSSLLSLKSDNKQLLQTEKPFHNIERINSSTSLAALTAKAFPYSPNRRDNPSALHPSLRRDGKVQR